MFVRRPPGVLIRSTAYRAHFNHENCLRKLKGRERSSILDAIAILKMERLLILPAYLPPAGSQRTLHITHNPLTLRPQHWTVYVSPLHSTHIRNEA